MGSVGCLKDIKEAISVARSVMEHTNETLLVGDDGNRCTVEPRNKGQDYVPVYREVVPVGGSTVDIGPSKP